MLAPHPVMGKPLQVVTQLHPFRLECQWEKTMEPLVPQQRQMGSASFYGYSQADRRRIVKTSSPVFFVTASQTQLLLAEARFKNWISSGTAANIFLME